jgi:bromodomain and WD repeat domain-containing protein 1/3
MVDQRGRDEQEQPMEVERALEEAAQGTSSSAADGQTTQRNKNGTEAAEEEKEEAPVALTSTVSARHAHPLSTLGIPDSFRSELYFLVAQFLSSNDATSQSAELLRKELSAGNLLQPRYDWTGRPHAKTFADIKNEVGPQIDQDHLIKLAYRLSGSSSDANSASTRTLLGRPRESWKSRVSWSVEMLRNQQSGISRCTPRLWIEKRLTPALKKLRRTLGHLSSVYCLIFDRTGKFAFTGADDLLVKCWRVEDGRLTHTFRGASSEISDLAISHDNRILAAGSCDKIIRVWCLRTATPLVVLSKHTGMITAIHFCPFVEEDDEGRARRYLAATSGDGTVSFWSYHYNEHDTAVFADAPTRYHEKIRPGQAQIICASFSPGGVFFCCGSADHHVRVYQMNASEEGPVRILEEEAHDDRVDSIQWCNSPGTRFTNV